MKRLTQVFLLLGACVFTDCNSGDPGGKKEALQMELFLYCAAGIRPPVAEIAEAFEEARQARITIDYAGSEVLLSKIKLVRDGDLYIPGDKHYLSQATEEGMILNETTLCFFVPVILVQKGNPKKVSTLRDLLTPGFKLGLGDAHACAIGRKGKKIFEKNGIPWKDVEKSLCYQSLTVNELGLQIQAGTLDGVIVWDAIARSYKNDGEEISIPAEQNIISTVNIGVLSFTKNRALAEEFLEFARSRRGRGIFQKNNYTIERPR